MGKLTDKKEAFCREYIVDFNATKAVIRAGYSEKTANRIASQLLSKLDIQERISELKSIRMERIDVNADYVLKRLVDIDQMDVADILTDGGDIKPIKEWPKVWRTTLSAIDIQVINSGDMEAITKKIKWPDKLRNIELIGKHIEVQAFLIKQETSHKLTDDFDALLGDANDQS